MGGGEVGEAGAGEHLGGGGSGVGGEDADVGCWVGLLVDGRLIGYGGEKREDSQTKVGVGGDFHVVRRGDGRNASEEQADLESKGGKRQSQYSNREEHTHRTQCHCNGRSPMPPSIHR